MTYQNTPQDTAQNSRLDALETGTLAGRTLSNPNVTGRLQLAETGTPGTPSAGTYRLYPKSDGNLYVLDANGVEYRIGGAYGVGVINYVTNPYANPNTDGYYLYSNTAQATPVTGSTRQVITSVDATNDLLNLAAHGYVVGDQLRFSTSGTLPGGLALAQTYFVVATTSNTFQVSLTSGGTSVDITSVGTGVLRAYRVSGTVTGLTLTRTGTSPIAGSSMLAIAKDGSNRQGLGVSTDFVIDRYLQNSDVTVSFAYQTAAGYVNGDVQPFIYDMVNDALIPLSIGGLAVATSSTSVRGTFRAAASGLVYRLIWHVAGTTAASWTLNVSNVSVGPQVSAVGSGVLNYCTNPDAESSTSGWATYADAAGVAPVDGTGGTPAVTWTRTTTTPLEGQGSFLLTKDAVNRQGQGASFDFTIAQADQGKQLTVSFVAQSSAGYLANDILMYVVDVTNSRVIQLAPAGIQKADGNSGANFTGIFQTSIDSTSYRLCFHVATTNASAYTLEVDRVSIAPVAVAFAAAVTDWNTAWTPTGSWVTNTTYTGRWRRVGNIMEAQVQLVLAGAPNNTGLSINLPPGFTIDTASLPGGTENTVSLGDAQLLDIGTRRERGGVILDTTTSVQVQWQIGSGSNAFSTTNPWTWAINDRVGVFFRVPIVGWGSNVQIGSYDGRTAALRSTTSSQTFSAQTTIIFSAVAEDSHGTYNAATGEYTVAVPGYYRIDASIASGSVSWTSGNTFSVYVQRNGANVSWGYQRPHTFTGGINVKTSGQVFCNTGDILRVRGESTVSTTLDGSALTNYFIVSLVPGRSTLAVGDTVAFAATKTSGSHTSTGSFQDVTSWTTEFDLTGSFNPTTGVWTCPIAGTYSGEAVAGFAANATGSRLIDLQVNGVTVRRGTNAYGNASFDGRCSLPFTIRLNVGDQVKVRAFQSSGVNLAYGTAVGDNYFSMSRTGN